MGVVTLYFIQYNYRFVDNTKIVNDRDFKFLYQLIYGTKVLVKKCFF